MANTNRAADAEKEVVTEEQMLAEMKAKAEGIKKLAKEIEEQEKAERRANANKIPQMLKLLCVRKNKDEDKIGVLLIEGTAEKDGSLNVSFPDNKSGKTPLVSGWMKLDKSNEYILKLPPLSDVPCILGVSGNFVQLLKVITLEQYNQIRSLIGEVM